MRMRLASDHCLNTKVMKLLTKFLKTYTVFDRLQFCARNSERLNSLYYV